MMIVDLVYGMEETVYDSIIDQLKEINAGEFAENTLTLINDVGKTWSEACVEKDPPTEVANKYFKLIDKLEKKKS